MNVTRCAIPDCRHRPLSLVQGGYTSQVARIQSQLIASWVGEGETNTDATEKYIQVEIDTTTTSRLPWPWKERLGVMVYQHPSLLQYTEN
jgi:hypothetical protein